MRAIALATIFVLSAVGCGKKSGEPASDDPAAGLTEPAQEAPAPVAGEPEPAAAADAEAPTAAPAPTPSAPPTVELVKPGKEPREPLRLQIAAGSKETMKLSMAMSMAVSAAGADMPPTKLPTLSLTMEVAAGDASEDGSVEVRSELKGVDVGEAPKEAPPGAAEQVKAQLATLVGLVQTGTLDARGFMTGADVTLPEGAPPQAGQMVAGMRNSLEQFAVPLPDEPVGVGAVWKVSQSPTVNGIEIVQSTEYKLLSRKGARLELQATVSQEAKSKFVELPQAPGMKLEIESWEGKGDGKVSMALDHLVPKSSTIDVDAKWAMKANGQSASYQMTNKTTVERQ